MRGNRNICPNCRGSQRCLACYGSGQNVHLNEPEPQCRACGGNGLCPACKGTGKLDEMSLREARKQFPIGLRIVFSVIPLILLYPVLKGDPVHWGKGGPIMPKWLGLLTGIPIPIFILGALWYGVTLAEFRQFCFYLCNPAQRQSLFDKSKPPDSN